MSTKDITDRQCVEAALLYHSVALGSLTMDGLDILSVLTQQPYKVCLRAYERAMRRGYLKCGVSTRTAFATKKGKELLT